MAPIRRPTVHRTAGLVTVATAVAEYLVMAVVVDIAAAKAGFPTGVRILLTIGCFIGHRSFYLWRRRRTR